MFLSTSGATVYVAVPSMAVTFQLLPQNSFKRTTSTARDGALSFSKVFWIVVITSQTLRLGGQESFLTLIYFQAHRFFAEAIVMVL